MRSTMLKKLLAVCVLGTLAIGSVAMASPTPPVDCTQSCAPEIFLENGTYCVLDGCLEHNGQVVYCNYACFWGLPPLWP